MIYPLTYVPNPPSQLFLWEETGVNIFVSEMVLTRLSKMHTKAPICSAVIHVKVSKILPNKCIQSVTLSLLILKKMFEMAAQRSDKFGMIKIWLF